MTITTDLAALRLENVTKQFPRKRGPVTPLKGVDLEVRTGEFVAVQGSTGGGKSTLLQVLGALDRPTSGHAYFGDVDLAEATPRQLQGIRATEIGFVFQAFNLIPTLTAAENVNMGLEPLDLDDAERQLRVADALERVGLADRADHRPDEMSGGQQQRVAIARAIAKRPRVLLADEPTGNLDERMRDDILRVLEQLNEEGLTLVVVTHDSAVAKRARRRLRLTKGTLRERE
ncbi:ABC transporter ATP-binding protein [Gulosibacter faecalis]|jgi:putative ABC transport system ATP-binding protein|uniref:ABC transporter ATP-binding protein n=1 Tax=Gulosibacter faecalis TaxID=272240 RepID=A0ABW5UYV0_9MICO|nr:ABC transporter ATP-binding protein [Gulosibacter faecalis]